MGEDAVSGWDVQGASPRVTSRFSADCPEGAHLPQPGEQLRLEEPCWQQEPGGNGPEKHEHGMFKDQKGKKVSAKPRGRWPQCQRTLVLCVSLGELKLASGMLAPVHSELPMTVAENTRGSQELFSRLLIGLLRNILENNHCP